VRALRVGTAPFIGAARRARGCSALGILNRGARASELCGRNEPDLIYSYKRTKRRNSWWKRWASVLSRD